MDKRILETIVRSQRERLYAILRGSYFERSIQDSLRLDGPGLNIVSGARGAGKTTMCATMLKRSKRPWGYINLLDKRLRSLTPADMTDMLEVMLKVYGNVRHLLIGNLPSVVEWAAGLTKLAQSGVCITVTVSHRLDWPVDDRHLRLTPLTYREYCLALGSDPEDRSIQGTASLRARFDDYLRFGGFPQLLHTRKRKPYLAELMSTALENDNAVTGRILNGEEWHLFALSVLGVSPLQVSYKGLAREATVKSEHTIKRYIEAMEYSALAVGLHKIAFHDKQRVVGEKIYAADTFLMQTGANPKSSTFNRLLETVVCNQLLSHTESCGNRLHYFADRMASCDFVICHNYVMTEGIQICFDANDERMMRSKVNGLASVAKATGCTDLTILTDNRNCDIESQGLTIKVRPAFSYLLDLGQ